MQNRTPLFLFVLASMAASVSLGCQLDDRVDLLRIVRVQPLSASAGERVTVWGEGFPEGKTATVTFQGDVFRPGSPPERDVRFSAKAKPGQRNSLVFVVTGDLERRLSGASRSAIHSTFHGDMRVLFEPNARGVVAIAGTYRGLALEFLPSVVDHEIASQRTLAGIETITTLGATVASAAVESGLRLAALDPDGSLYRAGLRAGDRMVEFDGVTVISPADLHPVPGERHARAVVERDGRLLPAFSIDVTAAAPPGASSLVSAGAFVLGLCAVFGFFASPLAKATSLFCRLASLRRRPAARRTTKAPARRHFLAQLAPSADAGPTLGIAAALVLAAIAVGFALLAFGRPILTKDVDLIVSVLAASLALLLARFFDGGFVRARGWSLAAAFGGAIRTLGCILPVLIAVAGVVFGTGRFVIEEIVADQGGVPWRWAAARNPGLLVLVVVMFAMTVPESTYRGLMPAEGLEPGALPRSTSRALVRLAEWTFLFMVSGISCALFLGGWRVPTVAFMAQEASRRLELLGAVLFFAKFASFVGCVLVTRKVFSRVFLEDISGVLARWGIAASAAGACIAVGWAAGFDGARSQAAAELVGYAVSALGVACLVATTAVLLRKSPPSSSVSGVNPWL